MRRLLLFSALAVFVLGAMSGIQLGQLLERRVWHDHLIQWGCAGYDARTGEWTITGGTCSTMGAWDPLESEDLK